MGEPYPDVEAGVRKLLRDDADVQAAVAGRVFFGVPREGAVFPLITVRRAGSSFEPSEAAIDRAVIVINCWGASTKGQAHSTMVATRKALFKIRRKTLTVPGVYVHGAKVDGIVWAPDPEDARPRYIVTSRVTATAT